MDIPVPRFNEEELSDFRAVFECHVRSLKNCNLTLDELFCVTLMNKLPGRMRELVKELLVMTG